MYFVATWPLKFYDFPYQRFKLMILGFTDYSVYTSLAHLYTHVNTNTYIYSGYKLVIAF